MTRQEDTSRLQSEAVQAQRLRWMKAVPLLLLLLMALVFILTLPQPDGWRGYLHAFSEAAMVGALADWFAVTALFRHPLGIPIPHTAIIARRKDEIGNNMARFVSDNFLKRDALHSKLVKANLAGRLTRWLANQEARRKMADLSLRTVSWLINAVGEERLRRFISRLGERHLDIMPLAPLAGKALHLLTEQGRHQDLLTQILRVLIVVLNDNREHIRGRIQQESPWWLPGFVDDKIVVQMFERIETLMFEMALDPEHEMRQRFNRHMDELARELQTSREYLHLGEKIKRDLLANEALHDYLITVWQDLGEELRQQVDDPDSPFRQSLERLYEGLAEELADDQEMQNLVNRWLEDAIVTVVAQNREEIASLISDTVKTWDADTTTRRVELAIGRDLQFIRINGTLVGGLVGLLLHFLVGMGGG